VRRASQSSTDSQPVARRSKKAESAGVWEGVLARSASGGVGSKVTHRPSTQASTQAWACRCRTTAYPHGDRSATRYPVTTRVGTPASRPRTAIAPAKYSQWPARLRSKKSAIGSRPSSRVNSSE